MLSKVRVTFCLVVLVAVFGSILYVTRKVYSTPCIIATPASKPPHQTMDIWPWIGKNFLEMFHCGPAPLLIIILGHRLSVNLYDNSYNISYSIDIHELCVALLIQCIYNHWWIPGKMGYNTGLNDSSSCSGGPQQAWRGYCQMALWHVAIGLIGLRFYLCTLSEELLALFPCKAAYRLDIISTCWNNLVLMPLRWSGYSVAPPSYLSCHAILTTPRIYRNC